MGGGEERDRQTEITRERERERQTYMSRNTKIHKHTGTGDNTMETYSHYKFHVDRNNYKLKTTLILFFQFQAKKILLACY